MLHKNWRQHEIKMNSYLFLRKKNFFFFADLIKVGQVGENSFLIVEVYSKIKILLSLGMSFQNIPEDKR